MKKIPQLLMLFALIMAISFSNAQEKAKIVFEETIHDFGTVLEDDGNQTTVFNFINKGESPLVLSNVRASCGCTTPRWTRVPVAPGEKGAINVTYRAKGRPGAFNKTITVSSNAENKTVVLRIKGKVKPHVKTLAEQYPRKIGALRVKTNFMSFGNLKMGQVITKELDLYNNTDKTVKVGFRSLPRHLSAKIEPASIPAHKIGKLLVTYDTKAGKTYGRASNRLYLTTNGNNDYKSAISINANIEEDFSNLTPEQLANAPVANFAPLSFDFGEMQQGEKKTHTFTLTNNGKSELIIRRIKTSCGCTAAAPSAKVIAPGKSAPVKVTFNSRGKRGRQSKTITVITNDPKKPTTNLRITANVSTNAG